MWIRLMPGVVVAAILTVFFSGVESEPPHPEADLSARVFHSLQRKRPTQPLLPDFASLGFGDPVDEEFSGGEPPQFFTRFPSPADSALAERAPRAHAASLTPPPTPASPLQLAIAPEMLSAPPPRAPERPRTTPRRPAPSVDAAGFTLARTMKLPRRDDGGGSETAYASMHFPADSGVDMADVPSGDLPPLLLVGDSGAAYSSPPARGVHAWASGGIARARQDPSAEDVAAYRMTAKKYSVGVNYDWTVDTVLGVSFDMLDYEVKSGHKYDSRKTDGDGLFANASMDTVMFDSYLLGLKGFYGSLESDGAGYIGAWDTNGASSSRWREPKHRSHMYGASANVSVPMLFWGYRVVVDAGVDYKRLKTRAHAFHVEESGPGATPVRRLSSNSLSIPVAFTMEKDFLNQWGMVTSRLGAGYARETSDSAGGVRSLHALSASPLYFDSNRFSGTEVAFDSARSDFYHVNLGLDVKTVGGWNVSVDYRRSFASEYRKDDLKLALGRSF